MPRVIVDSNVLLAARLERDENHDAGLELASAFDHDDLPRGIVLGSVLEEVLNLLQSRASHARAVETLDGLVESSGFEIERVARADLDAGRSVFRQFRGLSLTDAVIVAWMHRNDVTYLYSFDDDFDAVDGITRLDTPHDPFS
jgi:predicted nucleic acid-binding protein